MQTPSICISVAKPAVSNLVWSKPTQHAVTDHLEFLHQVMHIHWAALFSVDQVLLSWIRQWISLRCDADISGLWRSSWWYKSGIYMWYGSRDTTLFLFSLNNYFTSDYFTMENSSIWSTMQCIRTCTFHRFLHYRPTVESCWQYPH